MEHKDLSFKNKYHKYRYLLAGITVVSTALLCWLVYLYWPASMADGIHDYDAKRDRQAILDVFEKDWYWLVAGDRNSFSPEYMLDSRSPNKYNQAVQGQEKIKVMLIGGKPIGFITYYKKKAYLGQIHIIQVRPEYRGHGYAKQLMRVAIENLFSDPAISLIKLTTRTNNPVAIKVYKGLGFVEEVRDEALVDFTLKRDNYIK